MTLLHARSRGKFKDGVDIPIPDYAPGYVSSYFMFRDSTTKSLGGGGSSAGSSSGSAPNSPLGFELAF